MRLPVAVALLAATACASPDPPAAAPSSPVTVSRRPDVGGTPLPLGRSDDALRAGRWRSPETFVPAVSVEVTGAGWRSLHRFEDMFDVVRPEPGEDVPRLMVAFSIAGGTAAGVVRDVRTRMGAAATAPVPVRIGSLAATRFDVDGGTGEVYRSVTGGFGLYAFARQRVRFWVADTGDRVLVVTAIVADDATHGPVELARAAAVVATALVG